MIREGRCTCLASLGGWICQRCRHLGIARHGCVYLFDCSIVSECFMLLVIKREREREHTDKAREEEA